MTDIAIRTLQFVAAALVLYAVTVSVDHTIRRRR